MPDKIINHVVIDGQPGKFYAPNVLTGLEETDEITKLKSGISDLKENLNDLESDGVAPSAEQLLSKNMTADAVPYLFRPTGGDGADREYVDAIVGGTVNWNQLVRNGNFADTSWWSPFRGTITASGNVLTFTANSEGNSANIAAPISVTAGRKILFGVSAKRTTDGNIGWYIDDGSNKRSRSVTAGEWVRIEGIHSTTQNASKIYLYCETANAVANFANVVIHDLTAMFGSTIADYIYQLEQATTGAGVAWFKKLFPNDYYPYNAGELKSVEGVSAHKTVGFNQWDEEYVLNSSINPDTGADSAGIRNICSKNYIPVIPNTAYYIKVGVHVIVVGYDANKEYVGFIKYGDGNSVFTTKKNGVDKTIHYIRFGTYGNNYGTTYNHDICINLSDPTKNGTYEPYEEHSYPLDSDVTLRGIPKLDANNNLYYDGDRYLPDGKVERRYGVVDLGTLNWAKGGSGDNIYFAATISDIKVEASAYTTNVGMICSKYGRTKQGEWMLNKPCCFTIQNSKNFCIADNSYSANTAAEVKSAMSGVMLVYELVEPATEEADPYQHVQIVDDWGTEEYVSTGIVPVGHETRYPENLRAKIEGLPWDFSSLIAPTEKTTTASRNYTTGALLIVNNVLYKATANIANGGTITVGTNVTATTLAEVIAALS